VSRFLRFWDNASLFHKSATPTVAPPVIMLDCPKTRKEVNFGKPKFVYLAVIISKFNSKFFNIQIMVFSIA